MYPPQVGIILQRHLSSRFLAVELQLRRLLLSSWLQFGITLEVYFAAVSKDLLAFAL